MFTLPLVVQPLALEDCSLQRIWHPEEKWVFPNLKSGPLVLLFLRSNKPVVPSLSLTQVIILHVSIISPWGNDMTMLVWSLQVISICHLSQSLNHPFHTTLYIFESYNLLNQTWFANSNWSLTKGLYYVARVLSSLYWNVLCITPRMMYVNVM